MADVAAGALLRMPRRRSVLRSALPVLRVPVPNLATAVSLNVQSSLECAATEAYQSRRRAQKSNCLRGDELILNCRIS